MLELHLPLHTLLWNTSDSEKFESVIDMTVNPSSPDIDDGAFVGVENENYAVNEDGKRHYTLVAETSPVVLLKSSFKIMILNLEFLPMM